MVYQPASLWHRNEVRTIGTLDAISISAQFSRGFTAHCPTLMHSWFVSFRQLSACAWNFRNKTKNVFSLLLIQELRNRCILSVKLFIEVNSALKSVQYLWVSGTRLVFDIGKEKSRILLQVGKRPSSGWSTVNKLKSYPPNTQSCLGKDNVDDMVRSHMIIRVKHQKSPLVAWWQGQWASPFNKVIVSYLFSAFYTLAEACESNFRVMGFDEASERRCSSGWNDQKRYVLLKRSSAHNDLRTSCFALLSCKLRLLIKSSKWGP